MNGIKLQRQINEIVNRSCLIIFRKTACFIVEKRNAFNVGTTENSAKLTELKRVRPSERKN